MKSECMFFELFVGFGAVGGDQLMASGQGSKVWGLGLIRIYKGFGV